MTGSSVCGLERSMFTREETRVLTKVPRIKPVGVPNVWYVFVCVVFSIYYLANENSLLSHWLCQKNRICLY